MLAVKVMHSWSLTYKFIGLVRRRNFGVRLTSIFSICWMKLLASVLLAWPKKEPKCGYQKATYLILMKS